GEREVEWHAVEAARTAGLVVLVERPALRHVEVRLGARRHAELALLDDLEAAAYLGADRGRIAVVEEARVGLVLDDLVVVAVPVQVPAGRDGHAIGELARVPALDE